MLVFAALLSLAAAQTSVVSCHGDLARTRRLVARGGTEPPTRQMPAHFSEPVLIERFGYPVETHNLTTSDGYLLTLHRIPAGSARNRAVVLQHGVTGSSADWVLMGPGRSLGLLLADSGYDVWMTNDRGGSYSRGHTSLPAASPKYWDFSFHEAGTLDLPTAIEYILLATSESKLLLVAHSTGSSNILAMCASLPAVCDKLRGVVSLAPVAGLASPRRAVLAALRQRLASFKLVARKSRVYQVQRASCRGKTAQSQLVCSNFMLGVAGYKPGDIDQEVAVASLNYSSYSTSIKAVEHILQIMRAGRFQQFDYGAASNLRRYGTKTPPAYNLSAVSARVAIVYSSGDTLASPKDIDKLSASLPKVKNVLKVDKSIFKHFDYVLSTRARELVYDAVITLLSDLTSLFDFSSDTGVVVVSFPPQQDTDE
ncbi:lipase 1-like [Bacillus rossius redtenbacheri]|uniref:lipase 1-like n=1 Tax=Bacillus rossius redtenbacheri TaxID=93214 RepID=UPI002FDD4808